MRRPMVFLVHHAAALDPTEEPQRPLSAAGRVHAERLASEAAARGVRPEAIWHSGKLRARQTADAFWRACNPLAELAAIRGLQPADPPDWITDRLLGETRQVMLVGHQPHLSRLLSHLTRTSADVPLHGMVAVEWDGQRGREAWRLEGTLQED